MKDIFEGVDPEKLTWEVRQRVVFALQLYGVERAKKILAEALQEQNSKPLLSLNDPGGGGSLDGLNIGGGGANR